MPRSNECFLPAACERLADGCAHAPKVAASRCAKGDEVHRPQHRRPSAAGLQHTEHPCSGLKCMFLSVLLRPTGRLIQDVQISLSSHLSLSLWRLWPELVRNVSLRPKPYGKISTSKLPSPLDYASKHKGFVPGPTYVPPPWAKMGKPFCPEGGRYMLDARALLTIV